MKRVVVAVMCGFGFVLPTQAAAATSGGTFATVPAKISDVSCVSSCAGVDTVAPGSLVRLRGRDMRRVARIVFLGAQGSADNVATTALRARSTSVEVVVPERASSGPLRALNGDGAPSRPSRAVVSVQRGGAAGSGPLDVRILPRRFFAAGERPARVDLLARAPMAVNVALARLTDGAVIAAWPLVLAAGVVSSVTWDGTVAGATMPSGRYEFRVFSAAPATGAQAAQTAVALATGVVDLVDHKFPVRGKHNFGEGQAAFGAGRDGHSHQGHDIFARCDTPIVAARGGTVKISARHSAAGNYIVIDGDGTDVDYAYMHLRAPSPLKKGEHVATGHLVGNVGDTGHADGCHLHFEMWSGPGWYSGGEPFDPLPFLKAWDAYS